MQLVQVIFPPLNDRPAPKRRHRIATIGRGGRGRSQGRGRGRGRAVPLPPPVEAPPVCPPEPEPDPPGPGAVVVVCPGGGAGEPGTGGGAGGSDPGAASSSGGAGVVAVGEFFPEPLADDLPQGHQGEKVESIGGILVQFNNYMNKRTGKFEPHWVMTCRACTGSCDKRRGAIPSYEKEFGEIEPLAYLHIWHDIEWPTKDAITTHAQEVPPKALVRTFAREHAEELKMVCRAAGR